MFKFLFSIFFVSTSIISAQVQENAFIPFNQSVPPFVTKTRQDSIVVVEAFYPAKDEDTGEYYLRGSMGVGFVAAKNYVIAALHIFFDDDSSILQYNSIKVKGKDKKLEIEVINGDEHFPAKLVFYDRKKELALLEVLPPENETFNKKPAILADSTYITDDLGIFVVPHDSFYLFYFPLIENRNIYTPLEVGPYLSLYRHNKLKILVGKLQGGVEWGFSGSPLISPDGKVWGMAFERTRGGVYTLVITIETIKGFLEIARQFYIK